MIKDNERLIFVFECDEKSKTDQRYIRCIIEYYYEIKFDIRPIYLGGKSNYNKVDGKIIKTKKDLNEQGEDIKTFVIYFIDTDSEKKNSPVKLEDVKKYCIKNNYELILFCKGIEDVLKLGKVKGLNKVELSINFVEKFNIKPDECFENIKEEDLRKDNPTKPGESNILNVLDEYYKKEEK
jgi:hypothetical protein